jgi:ABC-type antimicrobial peptide transport system permease subunit
MRSDILLQFVAEGIACAFTGSVVGVVVGFSLLRWIDARLSQPFEFSGIAVASDLLGSIALYAAFTLASGLRATSIQPSVALRSE